MNKENTEKEYKAETECVTIAYDVGISSIGVSENQALGLDYKSDGLYVDSNKNLVKIVPLNKKGWMKSCH